MFVHNGKPDEIYILAEKIRYQSEILYTMGCPYAKRYAFRNLKESIDRLEILARGIQDNEGAKKGMRQGNFTLTELSKYNGRNGNPAYIAVEGVVYDVTNNAAWGAATHFGLSAGSDVTSAFNSCHSGNRNVLNSLNVVGRLV